MIIIDNDTRGPTEIANDLGFIGTMVTSAEVEAAVDYIISNNQ